MYLVKPLPIVNDNGYVLVCLKKDEALGIITLHVKPDLVHHTKDNNGANEIWDTINNIFGTVNTTQVN